MNKLILIFTLLVAFVISIEPECKHYEIFDEETNKCVKVCKEQQFVNEDEGKCEYLCKKGEIFNLETSSCQSNKTNEEEGREEEVEEEEVNNGNDDGDDEDGGDDEGDEKDDQEKGECKGGVKIMGKCICGIGKKKVKGICVDKKEKKDKYKGCKGGFQKVENVFVEKVKKK